MIRLHLLSVIALLGSAGACLAAEDYRLEEAADAPAGLAGPIAAVVKQPGVRIVGPKRPLCELYQVKSLATVADFKPTAAVKYPFTSGELLGVMVVPKRAGLTDFRGNSIEAGTYTLRYGRQPVDGNHIGTSDLADFVLAIPADKDDSPATITDLQELYQKSAAASGTTHPAIFSLQPVTEAVAEPKLTFDAGREFWILQSNVETASGTLPLRVVVVGKSEG